MITRANLEALEAKARPGVKVLSVYLDVDPTAGLWSDKIYALERSLDQIAASLGQAEQRAFAEDRARITGSLRDYTSHAKGLALFASTPQGLWESLSLQVPVKNEVRYDVGPYLGQLASLLDDHQSYGVALVDDRSARLFVVSLGEMEERQQIRNDVPGRHSQTEHNARVEVHHAAVRQEHLKEVAEALGHLHRTTGFRRLVIGGAVEALAHFQQELRPDLSRLVIGQFTAPMYANDKEVLDHTIKVAEAYEQSKETQTVEELLTRAAKNQQAVMGADETLFALRRNQVFELVTAGGLPIKGFQCTACGLLRQTHAQQCAQCGSTLAAVDDVADRAVQQAVAAGARVEVVNGPARDKLVAAGGIGALLSFGKT